MPSEAPVTTAQLPFGPNVDSYQSSQYRCSKVSRELRTDLPGNMNVLSKTLNVVYTIEAKVIAPTPSRAAEGRVC